MTKRILALLLGVVMLFTITVSATSGGADRAYDTAADAVYGGSSSDTRDDLSGGSQSGAQDALTPEQPAVPDDSADPDPLPSVTPDQPYVPLPDTTTTCACPDDMHLEGCPFYQIGGLTFFERMMATTTLEEYDAIMSTATEEEYFGMTDEERAEIQAHFVSLGGVVDIVYENNGESTVDFTFVAPFVEED